MARNWGGEEVVLLGSKLSDSKMSESLDKEL